MSQGAAGAAGAAGVLAAGGAATNPYTLPAGTSVWLASDWDAGTGLVAARAGSGPNFIQGTATNQPATSTHGDGRVYWDPTTNDFLSSASGITPVSAVTWGFFVESPTSPAASSALTDGGALFSNGNRRLIVGSSRQLVGRNRVSGDNVQTTAVGALADSAASVAFWVVDHSQNADDEQRFYVDGSEFTAAAGATDNGAATAGARTVYLFAVQGTSAFTNVSVSAVTRTESALSGTDRTAVTNWVNWEMDNAP